MNVNIRKDQRDAANALSAFDIANRGQLKISRLIRRGRRPNGIVFLIRPLHLAGIAASTERE